MSEQKKIEDMSVIEIKATLYEQIVILEQTNNNIKILQNELKNRQTKHEEE